MSGSTEERPPSDDRGGLDATGEFFSVGTPLHAVRAGYVRRVADDVLYETIRSGRYAHVIAPDRSGKSSLIAATAARLEANGYKVAVLDFEQIGARDAAGDAGRWNYSVAYRLLRQLRIRADLQSWWQDKSILQNRQRLLEFYSEIILQNVPERIVIFVDEIQCVEDLPSADQLLASIRAAHNARATDPDFSRLTFVLLGECDPLSLIDQPELSPFNVTQGVTLEDFSRDELDLFATELNLSPDDASLALDRIYYWTSGQPYLSQKLARAVSREQRRGDIAAVVDMIATQQLGGRAALHNEPHMSHIHRQVVKDPKQSEALLNLYGRLSKNVAVATDLGSPTQRRLIALGLLVIDEEGRLKVRNRLYRSVFTTRWANENLPNHWRPPAIAVLVILMIIAVPFWYTQILPQSYVDTLTSEEADLLTVQSAYMSFRTFPGHSEVAENLYQGALRSRAGAATEIDEVDRIAVLANEVAGDARLGDELRAGFWDRKARDAIRRESRDDALLATLESLVLSTSKRRSRAASLVADDYPLLIASLPVADRGQWVFNPGSMLLTESRFASVSQWSLGNQQMQKREDWNITALEVSPLVRRVIVDREETLQRAGLTLNLSHARVGDLRIKIIAPSGRAVEIDPQVERAFANQDLHIPPAQLADLVGEPMAGTWSLSIRDEELGVAGQLVGWNLKLNSQGLVEDFQRGLNVSDPVERETNNIWFSEDGRFAVARALQSDSARIWDLAFAKPVRAVAVSELEQFIGLSTGARTLVTATQDKVNLWDTSTGNRVASLNIGSASSSSTLTPDGMRLLVQKRSDQQTDFELWLLADAKVEAALEVAGTPALTAMDASGKRIAVADYDRAVRIWDLQIGELVAQIDLDEQPSSIELTAGGEVLGAVFGDSGASVWRLGESPVPVLSNSGHGDWQMTFSESGSKVLVGTPTHGFQIFDTSDGRRLGPAFGSGGNPVDQNLLGFSADELTVVTGGPSRTARFWQVPAGFAKTEPRDSATSGSVWPPAGDAVAVATPGAGQIVIGDHSGNVHIISADSEPESFQTEEEVVSFLGHSGRVKMLSVSPGGEKAASVGADNKIRVWDIASGLPHSFFGDTSGSTVHKLVFSPDAAVLAVLEGNQVQILDADSGATLAEFAFTEQHQSMAFAEDRELFVGSEAGTLRVIKPDSAGKWTLHTLWQGDAAIRWLEVSPRSRFLVFVDQNNLAQQFIIEEGRLGEQSVQLPSRVEEVAFAPGGSRVLLRTARWIHLASYAASGLHWRDAVFSPSVIPRSRIVFADPEIDGSAAAGNQFFLPSSGDGFVKLSPVSFDGAPGSALFGNKDELLLEWRQRLGVN